LATALACALALAVLVLRDVSRSESVLKNQIRREIQSDFLGLLEGESNLLGQIAREYEVNRSLGPKDGTIRVAMDSDCRMLDWSHAELLPSKLVLEGLCKEFKGKGLSDKNKAFYLLHYQEADRHFLSLIPLSVRYRVQNGYLPRNLYLGRYSNRSDLQATEGGVEVHLRQVQNGLEIVDSQGDFAFSISATDYGVFEYPMRDAVLLLSLLCLLSFWIGCYRTWKGKKLNLKIAKLDFAWIWIVGVLLSRALVFASGFPGHYRNLDLFSPMVLAIGPLNPSLGDLLLNLLTLLGCAWVLYTSGRRNRSLAFKHILSTRWQAWTGQFTMMMGSAGLAALFFHFIEELVLHSTIQFEFSNLFSLDLYSYLAFACIAAALVSLQLFWFELFRFAYHFLRSGLGWARPVFSVASFLLASWVFNEGDSILLVAALMGFAAMLVMFGRTPSRPAFRLDLLNFLLILSLFSLFATTGLVAAVEERQVREMALEADRQSDDHDLITEALFERVMRDVEAEAYLLEHTTPEGLSKRLNDQFFASSFKGYDVRIFIYDNQFNLLDKTGDYRPYLLPNSDPGLDDLGIPTKTRDLFLVKYYNGLFESIYVGRFELLLRSFGRLYVWVELLPNDSQPNQLYPNLLLDESVRNKSQVRPGLDFAVYKSGRLFRKSGGSSFPLLNESVAMDSTRRLDTVFGGFNHLYVWPGQDKIVHVRHRMSDWIDMVNLFSFIFYFFVLLAIVVLAPKWTVELLRSPQAARKLSLKTKIQVFFLGFAILPLFVVVFFLSPYIRAHLYRDIQRDLLQETQQVANLIREDYLRLRRLRLSPMVSDSLQQIGFQDLQSKLKSVEKIYFNDINLYGANGELQFTTQPSIYELGLTSRFMNPEVYRKMREGLQSDAVVEDKIGRILFFSAFYPLQNDERQIVGFLNIPSYKNQDRVDAQSLGLLTLLVNTYVFIFLAIGILAVLISNSITRPLALLSRKIGSTALGRRNEPLDWDSDDEIGEIIQAYNDMLGKLSESEMKLARSERESAWQEMARQVAHEIKNPLTPMKLSVQHLVRAWQSDKPESERLNALFDKVTQTTLTQIDSLVNIANSFSQFAQMPEPVRVHFRLQEVVEEVANLYSHDAQVQLDWDVPQEPFYVFSDKDQLSRVLNNLVKNAMQAIEHNHGMVKVGMQFLEGKTWCRISVQDNGKGIPEDIQPRIFEPKFSTKTSGMGLGLAIVRKIVESCGGTISFISEEGKGTTFWVDLPASDGQKGPIE